MEQGATNDNYSKGANIVQNKERSQRKNEPTGEAESLKGRDFSDIGTRVARTEVKSEQAKALRQSTSLNLSINKRIEVEEGADVLNQFIADTPIYTPKTKETKQIYDQILHILRDKLGDRPGQEIEDIANEVIATLRMEDIRVEERKELIQPIFNVDDILFAKILNFSKELKDYTIAMEKGNEIEQEVVQTINIEELEDYAEDEAEYVHTQIARDEEAENDQNLLNEIQDEDDQDEDEDAQDQHLKVSKPEEEVSQDFSPKIGLFWLSEKLGEIFSDPLQVAELETKVLNILEIKDEILCENKLLQTLGMEHFETAKTISENKKKVFFFTLFGKAANDDEKESVLMRIREDEEGQLLIDELSKLDDNEDFKRSSKPIRINISEGKGLKKLAEEAEKEVARFSRFENVSNLDLAKLHKKRLNLNQLVFEDAGHFMSNDKCQLPKGSTRQKLKGFEEVYIPPAEKHNSDIKLKKISSLPDWIQPVFADTKYLNAIQSEVYETAFKSAENMLVCAPTGAGKTNVALLTILHQIGMHRDKHGDIDLTKFKVVYIAPMKALVSEIVGSFSRRLESFGIQVREMTGDVQLSRREVENTQLIVATPEKWDIVTRKAGEKLFLDFVKLVIIDEIHLLHDARGPVIESIVARTLRHTESTKEHVRIVGLSATFPNSIDAANFLRVDLNKGAFFFPASYRPIPLEQRYIGITEQKGFKKLMLMKEILFQLTMERVGKQQVLIFCHSRKDTARTGRELRDQAYAQDELHRFIRDPQNKAVLENEVKNVQDHELKELLPLGIGIHHAGLPREDRKLVEELYSDKRLEVLISTATLAWGVNLPARTVIIKGTQIYSPEHGKWIELSPQDILQMLGRAGRPNLDTRGEGIIITGYAELKYYLSLTNTQLPIESQFLAQLPDQLNAEITLGTVRDLREAVEWLSYSYLYQRMLKSPRTYSISPQDIKEDPLLIKRRNELVHSAAYLLNKHNLIRYDRSAGTFRPTTLGRIASHYYIKHASIAVYAEHIRPGMGMLDLFKVFSLSSEFKYIPVRDSESVELERLLGTVPVPVRGSHDDPRTKINVLLQAHISRMRLDGYALKSDMIYVTQSASRIMRGLFEVFLKRGWANVAENCLRVCKMIDKKQWDCMSPLRQFATLPEKIFRRIENQEHLTWEHFFNMNSQQIGNVIRYEKLGSTVQKLIHQFPRLSLDAYVQPLTRSRIRIELLIKSEFEWVSKIHGNSEPFWIMVTDVDDEVLLYHELFILKKDRYKEELELEFTVPLLEPLHPQYFVKVISNRWLHCETVIPVSFKNLLLPSKFPPCTELLEMKQVPQSHFGQGPISSFLKKRRVKHLNSIQTQIYDTLYNSFDSILVGAPGNSGKTLAALIGLGRLFEEDTDRLSKALFLTPTEDILKRNLEMLKEFCRFFNRTYCVLTGVITDDLAAMNNSDLIISCSEHWDNVSRRWRAKNRKAIHSLRLVIFEHIHLINSNSSAYEVSCARLRLMFTELEQEHRFIVLGTSIANSTDVADWLGIHLDNVYNFHPSNRPTELDLFVHSFDQHDAGSRFYAITRALYQSIEKDLKKDQILIFVDSKKSARLTSSHLASYCSADDKMHGFADKSRDDFELVEQACQQIGDAYLRFYLMLGIGFVHEGMPEEYKTITCSLFTAGLIRILIQTHSMVWCSEIRASSVAILDTKYYNGVEDRMIDYSLEELLEFISRSGRLHKDKGSKVLLFCHSSIKEHLQKFLFSPLPVESKLHLFLEEHINAEIASKTIESRQQCIDWIAWTFFYRRLQQNPNFYNLLGISDAQKNEHLSELIETTVENLALAECIVIEDEESLVAINGGKISTYYYIHIKTVNLFLQNITSTCKWKTIFEVLSLAKEFEQLEIREGEDVLLKGLHAEAIHKLKKPSYFDPAVKANLLIQSHIKRSKLSHDLYHDKKMVLDHTLKLLKAMTDCICYNGWLRPAIMAMKMSQMVVQGMWVDDSQLKQLPYFDDHLINLCKQEKVETIDDLMEMDEEARNQLLKLKKAEMARVANVCNRFPEIDLDVEAPEANEISLDEGAASFNITLQREGFEEGEEVGPPISYAYPRENAKENWWIVAGDPQKNKVLGIKMVSFETSLSTNLRVTLTEPGEYNVQIYLICDSYVGCDQESDPFTLKVL